MKCYVFCSGFLLLLQILFVSGKKLDNKIEESSQSITVLPVFFNATHNFLELVLKRYLPTSYGNCEDKSTPKSCQGFKNLYESKTMFSNVIFRSVSGLDSFTMKKFIAEGKDGKLLLNVMLTFDYLKLNLRSEVCLLKTCTKFYDGSGSCCGNDIDLSFSAAFDCSQNAPFLSNGKVTELTLSTLKIEASLPGNIKLPLKDITSHVQNGFKDALSELLNRGIADLNDMLQALLGNRIYCDAQRTFTEITSIPPSLNLSNNASSKAKETLDPVVDHTIISLTTSTPSIPTSVDWQENSSNNKQLALVICILFIGVLVHLIL